MKKTIMKLFTYTVFTLLIAFSYLARFSYAQSTGETLGALLAKLDLNQHRVQSVAFSPDGRLLAAGYGFFGDGGITIWKVDDYSVVATPVIGNPKKEGINQVAFSADGKLFAAASDSGNITLWNVGSWQLHKTVLKHQSEGTDYYSKSTDLAFSPDSTKLVFSSDKAVILYDLKTSKMTKVVIDNRQDESINSVLFSPNGGSLILCADKSIQVWDIKSGKKTKIWRADSYGFFGRLSPEGKHIILGGGSLRGGSLEIWNYPEGQKIKEISNLESGVFTLAISNSGNLFAVASGGYGSGGNLSLWTTDGASELGFVSFGTMPIQGVAFNPNDTVVAVASESGAVLLYNVDRLRGKEVKKQDFALCGEIVTEGNITYITPISKVPRGNDFGLAWKLEIANADVVIASEGLPVILQNWQIESGATGDCARIIEFKPLFNSPAPYVMSNYIIFGDVQNPGWNQGFIAKIYGDGSFVATTNFGKCVAYGNLDQLKTDFQSVKERLVGEGLLSVPKEPLTIASAHFRTCFIGLMSNGMYELRSDADSFELLLKGGPSKKREAFNLILDKEESFLTLLKQTGIKLPSK